MNRAHIHCDQHPHRCSFEELWDELQRVHRELRVWRARALQAERRSTTTPLGQRGAA